MSLSRDASHSEDRDRQKIFCDLGSLLLATRLSSLFVRVSFGMRVCGASSRRMFAPSFDLLGEDVSSVALLLQRSTLPGDERIVFASDGE